ncbi:hypothetical protein CHCC20335_3732 [Bacillus paralicheniformis]|nr:hypothetical protein CHCC20335_3732 [Bacillus paralicheniformis]
MNDSLSVYLESFLFPAANERGDRLWAAKSETLESLVQSPQGFCF